MSRSITSVAKRLHHRAVLGVVLEAQVADEVEVEVAVAVLVGLGEEAALLGVHEVDRHPEHELANVVGLIGQDGVLALQVHELAAQLA